MKQTTLFPVTDTLTPPLKWAGGKRWLLPQLQSLWQPRAHRRLVEPFCGGLSVSLGLRPDRALLGDVNPHLVNFYRCLQRGFVSPLVFENSEEFYYDLRGWFNTMNQSPYSESSPTRAAFFYYLNRTGFNGLCRFNQKGEYNVPYGKYKHINYIHDFRHYAPALQPWDFVCGDFAQMQVEPDDFIYADPPYDGTFTGYSAGGFDWDDQVRLAEWLERHDGPVVASNAATERIVHLYQSHGFSVQTIEAPRRISCNGDRAPVMEMLATRGLT